MPLFVVCPYLWGGEGQPVSRVVLAAVSHHEHLQTTRQCPNRLPIRLLEVRTHRLTVKRAIFLQLADEVPPVIPEALEEFFRGIPGVNQDKRGLALEPMARLAQEFQGQRILGDSPFVPPAEGERHAMLTVGPDEQDHRYPEAHLASLVRPDPGGLAQQTCRRFRHHSGIHDERAASPSKQARNARSRSVCPDQVPWRMRVNRSWEALSNASAIAEHVVSFVKYSKAMRYIQSGSGIESCLPKEILCLFLCGFPRLRNFCYEWKRAGKGKVPYRIALKTEEPFAFAGLWSAVHDAQGAVQPTFAILTTEANALVSQIHNRMPVILREQDEEDWLNPRLSLDEAQALLVPLPAELLMTYEVSPKVNSPVYNTPDLLQPVA
jgi:SOS response associated peptidase (SRAP)